MQKYHDEPKQYKGYLKSALNPEGPKKMTRVVRLVHQLSWNLAYDDDRPALD